MFLFNALWSQSALNLLCDLESNTGLCNEDAYSQGLL